MRTIRSVGSVALLVVLAVALSTGTVACGDDGGQSRSLTLRVFNSNPNSSEGFPPAIHDSIAEVRVRIYQNARELTDRTQVFDFAAPSGRLSRLDFGDNYQIIVEALGLNQQILADGATPVFDFHENSSIREIQVFVSVLNSIEYASALYVSGSQVVAAPSEFEGPFVAQELGLSAEALGGQRAGHTVTQLPDGRILVIGGARLTDSGGLDGSPFASFIDTVEVFDPANGYWTLVRDLAAPQVENTNGNLVNAPMRLSAPRAFHTATLMDDGNVAVVGGFYDAGSRIDASSAVEIIDPTKGTIQILSPGGADLLDPRALHTAHWFNNRLWIIGGVGRVYNQPSYLTSVEVYDPEAGYLERAIDGNDSSGDLNLFVGRAMHTSVELIDGLLILGGRTDSGVLNSMEFLQLAESGDLRNYFESAGALPGMASARFGHEALLLERDFENSTQDNPLVYIAVAGGYTAAEAGGDLLTGTAISGSVEFIEEQSFGVQSTLGITLNTPRAHFSMVETSIARDLLILGGIGTSEEVTNTVERLRRTADGGFPLFREDFATLRRPRAYADAVGLDTHSMMIVGGWEGGSNTGVCGQTAPTAGCTSELANVGDLFYLGFLY